MKYTSKLYILPGGTVEATDEEGNALTGTVRQANPDGAMFVEFPGEQFLQIVWGPVPKPVVIAPIEKPLTGAAGKKNAELQAENKQLQGQVADQAARIAELEAGLAKANEGLTAAQVAAKPAAAEEIAAAPGGADDSGEKHFTG